MSPADLFDEAIADMISDGVTDLFPPLIKMHFEKDETKKVIAEQIFQRFSIPRYLSGFTRDTSLQRQAFLNCLLWELGLHVTQLQLSKL